jgi:hypothetical protein
LEKLYKNERNAKKPGKYCTECRQSPTQPVVLRHLFWFICSSPTIYTIAKVIWQDCANASSLRFMQGCALASSTGIVIEASNGNATCGVDSAGINVTMPFEMWCKTRGLFETTKIQQKNPCTAATVHSGEGLLLSWQKHSQGSAVLSEKASLPFATFGCLIFESLELVMQVLKVQHNARLPSHYCTQHVSDESGRFAQFHSPLEGVPGHFPIARRAVGKCLKGCCGDNKTRADEHQNG